MNEQTLDKLISENIDLLLQTRSKAEFIHKAMDYNKMLKRFQRERQYHSYSSALVSYARVRAWKTRNDYRRFEDWDDL